MVATPRERLGFDRAGWERPPVVVVSHFVSSVICQNGQWDDPRLIGGMRRGLEQVRFIGSQV